MRTLRAPNKRGKAIAALLEVAKGLDTGDKAIREAAGASLDTRKLAREVAQTKGLVVQI
jgi:hypothetical protein